MNWKGLDIGVIEFNNRSYTVGVLRKIFECIVSKGKTVVLIRYTSDVMEMLHFKNYSLLARPWVTVVGCASIQDIEEFVEYINRIPSWHATEFCILIGSSEMPKEIVVKFKGLLSVFRDFHSLWFMDRINSVNGIIQPLDDDFGISGDGELDELIKPIVSERG